MTANELPIVGYDPDLGDLTDCTTCDGTGVSTYRGEAHRTYDEPDYQDNCAICGGSGMLPVSMFATDDDEYDESLAKEDARNAWQHDGDPDYDTSTPAKEDRRNGGH